MSLIRYSSMTLNNNSILFAYENTSGSEMFVNKHGQLPFYFVKCCSFMVLYLEQVVEVLLLDNKHELSPQWVDICQN